MDFFTQHITETKKVLQEKADKILLNDTDLELDKGSFAPLLQKAHNVILTEYLTDYANERIDSFNNISNSNKLIKRYKRELVYYLRDLIREKI